MRQLRRCPSHSKLGEPRAVSLLLSCVGIRAGAWRIHAVLEYFVPLLPKCHTKVRRPGQELDTLSSMVAALRWMT